uniref:hypothetical protein n=1 Tax=Methylobacterium sp. B34 TaxID=95563 RepID=UPI0003459856|nr:hypothetical protein [Methylobacterium sp. B34]
MTIEPYTIETEAEARVYLADLLRDPKKRNDTEIRRHCDLRVTDPAMKAFFLAEGAKMLDELKS